SLILGSNLPAGNGYIAANHYVFDQTTGTQTIPAQHANLPFSDNNADLTVRGNAILGGAATTNALQIEGTGKLSLNGQKLTVNGNFSTTGSALLGMTTVGDSLGVSGNATFDGGVELANLTEGTLSIGGNFSQSGTLFDASGNHRTIFSGAAAQ